MSERGEFSPDMGHEGFDQRVNNEIEELRATQKSDPEQFRVNLENLAAMLSGQGEGVSEEDIEVKVELSKSLERFPSATPSEQAELKGRIYELAGRYSHGKEGGLDRQKIAILREYFKPEDSK